MADPLRVCLRTASPADEPLLVALYAQTRAAELDRVEWPAGQRDAFVRSQWELRTAAYHGAHPGSSYSIVTVDVGAEAVDVGCLFVAQLEDGSIRVVDIVLLEEWCGRGVGTEVLGPIVSDADEIGVAVSLHVDPHTAAARFYERLGFEAVGDDPTYRLMVRAPRPGRPIS